MPSDSVLLVDLALAKQQAKLASNKPAVQRKADVFGFYFDTF
jgi:hypothetical protein